MSKYYIQSEEWIDIVRALMADQRFDGAGHVIERVAPSHSAVVKAHILLEEYDNSK